MISDDTIQLGQKYIDVILPTYILKPEQDTKLYPSQIRKLVQEILEKDLEKVDEKWIEDWSEFGDDFEALSKSLSEKIRTKCKESLNIPRYKLVIQVTIGQIKDQGVCITSRCLWNTFHDNYASVCFKNRHIWVCALVFGLYVN